MKEIDFNEIKNRLKSFQYNSLEYCEYEQVQYYEVEVDNETVIIVKGYNKEQGIKEIHWAADTSLQIVKFIEMSNEPVLVTFVPEEWKDSFINSGFKEYAVYREYWIEDIRSANFEACSYALIETEEINSASSVTLECCGQSRGFRGESPEWIESWINGTECGLENAKDFTILVHCNNNEVNGIVCVAIYGHESLKGPILWVREVAVIPKMQGHGIGRKLLEQALSYGSEHGAKRAFLMADECNSNAKRLYEDIGFIPSRDEVQIDMIYAGKEKSVHY